MITQWKNCKLMELSSKNGFYLPGFPGFPVYGEILKCNLHPDVILYYKVDLAVKYFGFLRVNYCDAQLVHGVLY